MSHLDTTDEERIERVILHAVRHILEHQDAARFLEWAQSAIPVALELDTAGLEPVEERRLAVLLATAIWNATPLPDQGFRPRPMPPPQPEAACPCGSGLTYGKCCARMEKPPELPTDLIWELALAELGEDRIKQAVAEGSVPRHLLGVVADRWLDADHPRRAVALLEALFDGSAAGLDERFDPALNVLCDAYDRLDHWKKKRDLLARMTEHECRALRAAAWQRLATIHIDEGDFEQAGRTFTQALREGPDSPGTALLEITLLAAQHNDELARERAGFWRRRLFRSGLVQGGMIDFLSQAAKDPLDALIESQAAIIDPLLLKLRDWARTAAERSLPDYGIEPWVRGREGESFGQMSLFDEEGSGGAYPGPPPAKAMGLHPSSTLRRLETRWRPIFGVPKPRSIWLAPVLDGDVWERDDWIRWLEHHPEAADSLDILDDVATAIYVHPESSLPWISRALLVPLLQRGSRILERAPLAAEGGIIPWSIENNRPALRLLFRLYLFQAENGFDEAAATIETLLRLNPSDNHGVRAELMNHYLRLREDLKALELAKRFPGDTLAELAFGEVLALYRLGQKADAERALRTAVRRMPRIPHYLTRKRVRRPSVDPSGAKGRGDAQAWLYRETMRDVWEAEPGALSWLKRHAV
jgi:tetratricopeptide (TPR) repeat protein